MEESVQSKRQRQRSNAILSMRNLHRHGTSAMMRTAATTPSSPAFIGMIPKHYEKHVKTVAIVFAAMVCVAPVKFFSTIWHLLFQVVGIALGVGFGFGLAMHVYEQLQQMHKASEVQTRGGRRLAVDDIRPKTTSRQTSNVLEDGTSFFSLMASAGYPQDTRVLRGQVLRENASFWDNQYRFTDVTVEEQRGPRLLQEEWPSLPPSVTKELGRFVEHLMRDFISGWYCKIDKGVVFTPEAEKRKDGIARDGGKSLQDSSETSAGGGGQEQQTQEQQPTHHVSRKMVFSTQLYRQIPMIDQTYRVLSATFGNLATRAECVNVFQLALLKIPKVLAHTFKVYRHLRKSAEDKNMTENPSEIQVIREFLLAGKLHRAVTFGLDVPSLLFADASGEECGNGSDEPPNPNPKDPLQVLEQRLFQTPMLKECEVDYNRVVAHRLVRALLPRADSSSQVVMALNVEIFAACVLQPLMNLWIPSFLNNMIVSAMKKKKQYAEINKDREVAQDTDNTMADGVTKIAKNGAEVTGKSPEKTRNSIATVASVPVDYATTSSSLLDSDKEANMSTVDPLSKESSILSMEIDSEVADKIDLQDEDIDMTEHDDFEEKNAKILGKLILKITSLALIELQKYMKFEECRLARGNLKENRVDWDNPACQAAVLRLVMVIEAVLLQGRCMYRRAVETNGVDEEGTEIRKETERPIANDSFPQLLMEMTSDMNAFEKRIDAINAEGNTPMLIDDTSVMDFEPDPSEISTLRTLVSTWLHTGQAFRAISLIIKAQKNAFAPFYCNNAFLSVPGDADGFLELVKVLDGVDVMVETMAVLSSPRLDLEAESDLVPSLSSLSVVASKAARKAKSDFGRSTDDQTSTTHAAMAHFGNTSTPRYLDFHRNSAFASSLRSERERRMRSWETLAVDETIQTVHRKSASSTDIELHQELHNLSRIFYNGTNVMTIRDAARKSDSDERQSEPATGTGDQEKVSLLTVEMVSNRRRIEVPDDDSSFLLRAQVCFYLPLCEIYDSLSVVGE